FALVECSDLKAHFVTSCLHGALRCYYRLFKLVDRGNLCPVLSLNGFRRQKIMSRLWNSAEFGWHLYNRHRDLGRQVIPMSGEVILLIIPLHVAKEISNFPTPESSSNVRFVRFVDFEL